MKSELAALRESSDASSEHEQVLALEVSGLLHEILPGMETEIQQTGLREREKESLTCSKTPAPDADESSENFSPARPHYRQCWRKIVKIALNKEIFVACTNEEDWITNWTFRGKTETTNTLRNREIKLK